MNWFIASSGDRAIEKGSCFRAYRTRYAARFLLPEGEGQDEGKKECTP